MLPSKSMELSPKFEEALVYATRVHGGQLRKKTNIPYIGHLLGVTAIAMEYGANETEAIAALLHDVVEDCGGPARQREIEEKFGRAVGEIVAGCTDTDQTPKPPWRERKEKVYRASGLGPGFHPARLGGGQAAQRAGDRAQSARRRR